MRTVALFAALCALAAAMPVDDKMDYTGYSININRIYREKSYKCSLIPFRMEDTGSDVATNQILVTLLTDYVLMSNHL